MNAMITSTTYKVGDSKIWDKVLLGSYDIEVIEIDTFVDGYEVTVYHYDSDVPVPFEDLRGAERTAVESAWDAWEASQELVGA